VRIVQHEKFVIKEIKSNFLTLEIHENETIDENDIHFIYKGYTDLVGGNQYVVAVYANPFSSISPDARKIAAEKYASLNRKKVALISTNFAHILIIKLFIKLNKPKTPIQIFRDSKSAFDWLESD
jgi:hypothetical protein